MHKYTLYCTETQTRKALELGAPIESEFEYQFLANQEHGYYRGGTFIELVECMGENTMVFGYEPNRVACIIPTAEQIIGWLESNPQIHHITVWKECVKWGYTFCYKQDGIVKRFDIGRSGNRKEATLAAIDAVLEYLENLKQ